MGEYFNAYFVLKNNNSEECLRKILGYLKKEGYSEAVIDFAKKEYVSAPIVGDAELILKRMQKDSVEFQKNFVFSLSDYADGTQFFMSSTDARVRRYDSWDENTQKIWGELTNLLKDFIDMLDASVDLVFAGTDGALVTVLLNLKGSMPSLDDVSFLRNQMWFLYISNERIRHINQSLFEKVPAWKVERLKGGLLIINGPSAFAPSGAVSTASAVTDYFRKKLEGWK